TDGLVQGLLHLPVPGVIHLAGEELPGHENEEQGGEQGEADEGEDQAGAQPGAEDFAAPLQGSYGHYQRQGEGDEGSFPPALARFPELFRSGSAVSLHQPLSGNLTVKMLPASGAVSTSMVPPWSVMILWTTASPKPVPFSLVVKKG